MAAGEAVITEGRRDEVLAWRYSELVRAGYGRDAAALLAKRRGIDLHLAVGLLRRGCPPRTALRILV